MLRIVVAVFLVAAAVQAIPIIGPGDNWITMSVIHGIQTVLVETKDLLHINRLEKAGCVSQFSLIPISKETVDKSNQCISNLKVVADVLDKKLPDARAHYAAVLKTASEEKHDVFQILQLCMDSRKYFLGIFKTLRSDPESQKAIPEYVKSCLAPVIDEISDNVLASKENVKKCMSS